MNKIKKRKPTGPKDIVAQKHREKHFFTHANSKHICFYMEGSLLEGRAGTEIYACLADEMVHELKYYLHQQEKIAIVCLRSLRSLARDS